MSGKTAFAYKEYLPSAPLGEYVECFWVLKGSSGKNKILRETLVPGGRIEVIFSDSPIIFYGKNIHAKGKSFSGNFVMGPRDTACYAGFKGVFYLFGIRFRFGCLPLFIKHPAYHYSNRLTPLSSIPMPLPFPSFQIDDKIQHAIKKAEDWLQESLRHPSTDWYILQDLIKTALASENEGLRIKTLSAEHGWDYKKSERVFLKYIGFPPRSFLRLQKFRQALEKTSAKPNRFTGTAHQLGFYDQSHYIREFYRYTGTKPSSFYKDPPRSAIWLYKIKQ